MSESRLGKVAQVAEITAAVAVVVFLVFVGLEVRENTAAIQASTVQAVTASTRDVLLNVALDEDFARIRRLGEQDLSQLTEDEAYRFFQFSRQNWLHFQSMWTQWRLGAMDDRSWESFARIACSLVRLPGGRADWPSHVDALDSGFVLLMEACLD